MVDRRNFITRPAECRGEPRVASRASCDGLKDGAAAVLIALDTCVESAVGRVQRGVKEHDAVCHADGSSMGDVVVPDVCAGLGEADFFEARAGDSFLLFCRRSQAFKATLAHGVGEVWLREIDDEVFEARAESTGAVVGDLRSGCSGFCVIAIGLDMVAVGVFFIVDEGTDFRGGRVAVLIFVFVGVVGQFFWHREQGARFEPVEVFLGIFGLYEVHAIAVAARLAVLAAEACIGGGEAEERAAGSADPILGKEVVDDFGFVIIAREKAEREKRQK